MRFLIVLSALICACSPARAPTANYGMNAGPDGGDNLTHQYDDAGTCTPETDTELCLRLSLSCGEHDATDLCGVTVRLTCLCDTDGGLALCEPDRKSCEGVCIDPKTDSNNCDQCGTVCAANMYCYSGNCICTYRGPHNLTHSRTTPGGVTIFCIVFEDDNNNCGACGHECTNGQTCHDSHCQ